MRHRTVLIPAIITIPLAQGHAADPADLIGGYVWYASLVGRYGGTPDGRPS